MFKRGDPGSDVFDAEASAHELQALDHVYIALYLAG
jgi:hypothetical protein